MVKVIIGLKGHGKTKQLIELVNEAVHNESGNVVCIERGQKLTYDINHKARLIDVSNYPITSFERLKAFICGMYSGNYDISHIFIDSLFKVAKSESMEETENFLNWVDEFGTHNEIAFTITISAEPEKATKGMQKYID